MAKESRELKSIRVKKILKSLAKHYPDAKCALNYETPFQLLIATILSAQCTDVRVNIVTEELFRRFPDAESMSRASLEELEELVRSTGFFRSKAKSLKGTSEILVKEFLGQVPKELDALTPLPGVGRKTANVVLGNAFNIPSGVVVDTHVRRLSNRLGLVKEQSPEKIEMLLGQIVPQDNWVIFSHWLIEHGRRVCSARKPDCEKCFLATLCPKRI